MLLLGISGRAQSGKDTAGGYFQKVRSGKRFTEEVGWNFADTPSRPPEIKKFAGKLKDSIQLKFPNLFNTKLWEEGDSDYRDCYLPQLDMTRRELLIREAMALRALCTDYWVEALFNEYKKVTKKWNDKGESVWDDYPDWIITDLRFPNEFKKIRDLGGILIRIERPNIPLIDSISETSLDLRQDWDYVISNDGDEIELIKKVEQVYESIKSKF